MKVFKYTHTTHTRHTHGTHTTHTRHALTHTRQTNHLAKTSLKLQKNEKLLRKMEEITCIVDELIDRVVLAETFIYDFHPDYHPLIKPLGQRKENNTASNKRKRSESMETQFDPDEMTENMCPLHEIECSDPFLHKNLQYLKHIEGGWKRRQIMNGMYALVHDEGHSVLLSDNNEVQSVCYAGVDI